MSTTRLLPCVLLFLLWGLGVQCARAQGGPVEMKWKIAAGDTLVYRTTMKETDSAAYARFGGLLGLLGDSLGSRFPDKWLDEAAKEGGDTRTYMAVKRPGVIGIEMREVETEGAQEEQGDSAVPDLRAMARMMARMSGGVMLRGAVYEDGRIESFYLNRSQLNLIAMYFQLPARPARVGDVWSLDVGLLSMDQNFICDSSARKNEVRLVEVRTTPDGPRAVVAYDVEEYVSGTFNGMMGGGTPTMMHMTFKATAEFDLHRGRWAMFGGLMSIKSTGFMSTSQRKEFMLVPE